MLYNANKPAHKPAAEPAKFHPFSKKSAPKRASAEDLKKLFGPDWQKYV